MRPIICTVLCWLLAQACWADLPEVVRAIKPAIVGVGTVQLTRRPPARLYGTGFVVGNGRTVVTNAHNLSTELDRKHNERIAIFLGQASKNARFAQVIGQDRDHDLALLSFKGEPVPTLTLGDSSKVREGEFYAFTGFPIGMVLGMRPVTHRGIISAITPIAIPQLSSRQLDAKLIKRLKQPYDVFQLDATAYPGNSGSPLYDPERGRVIGVINKVFVKETKEHVLDKPSGITYAIPTEYVLKLLRESGAEGF